LISLRFGIYKEFLTLPTELNKFKTIASFFVLFTAEKYQKGATQKEGMARLGVMLSSKLEKHHNISHFTLPNLR